MKTVDANYSYDELEGFETLDLKRPAPRESVWLSMQGKNLSFSKQVRELLFVKKHIRISYNREQRKLLIASAQGDNPNDILLPKTAASCVSCSALQKLLEEECRYGLTNFRMHVPGEAARSRKNAFIFDLGKAAVRKVKVLKASAK